MRRKDEPIKNVYFYQEPGAETDILVELEDKLLYFMRKPLLDNLVGNDVKVFGLVSVYPKEHKMLYGRVWEASEKIKKAVKEEIKNMNHSAHQNAGLRDVLVLPSHLFE